MSNYQEGSGPYQEGTPAGGGQYQGGAPYQEGAYQEGVQHQGGAHYQESPTLPGGGPYQGTPQFQGGGQPGWGGHQGHSRGGLFGSGGMNTKVRSTFKTTEFWIYVVVTIALLIAAAVSDSQGFGAQEVWKYVTYLTIGYLISRGLTKFGGHERSDHDHDQH